MSKSKFILIVLSFLLVSTCSFAQTATLKGVVMDKSGEPVIGANVIVKGTQTGSITDFNGNFTLADVPTEGTMVVTFIGYVTQEVAIKGQSSVTVTLAEDNQTLDEVVVIGYQTVRRKDLTGSVASVNGKNVAATPVSNVAQALQGKLPGVHVTSQDGRPDAEVSIRIRGGGSISQSNDPLVLIDGIASSLSDIPADQIESIDVLKDASSTAIYGARGANGVILVTTKGAKEGKFSVSYNGYAKFNKPTGYVSALNPYDYLSYVWANADANGDAYRDSFEKLFGLGPNAGSNTGGIESYRNMKSDDIQRDVYNDSFSHNHDLTVTGGTERTKLLFSVNYSDEEGMKINSYAKRANVSLKINQKIFDNIDLSVDARYTDAENMGDGGDVLSTSYRFRPIATNNILGDLDELLRNNVENYGKQTLWDRYSPVNRIKDNEPFTGRQQIRSTVSLDWRILKGLTYHTDLSLNRTWKNKKTWTGAIYNNYIDDVTGEKLHAGAVDYEKSDSWGLRWSNTLNYDFTLNDIHRLNFLVGHEVTDSGGSNMRITATHFPSNFTKENAFAMINQYDPDKGTYGFTSGASTPSRILSFFGRANYTLMDRYLFTFTFRADGSSKFSPDNRWGYFPAGAIAWRASEEAFLKDVSWLDNLKLRVSYGQVGNDGIDSGLWSQEWSSEAERRMQYVINNTYQQSYKYSSDEMANRDLKWETTITRNIGVDFGLFNNRLWGTIDVYKNTTKDLLLKTSIPGITGYTATYANVGQTSNKGVELSLGGVVFKSKDWNITAGANINFNKGNVDELADNVTGLYSTRWASSSTFPINDYILEVGHPVGRIRGLVYDGFYTTDDFIYENGVYTLKESVADVGSFIGTVHGLADNVEKTGGQIAYPGVVKYKDVHKDGIIDEKDVQVIGDTNPIHTGGFNFSVAYKNFDLGAYFNWSYGNDIYNLNKLSTLYGYKESGVYENKMSMLKNSYKIYDIVDGQLVRYSTPEDLKALNQNATLPLAYNENGVTSSIGIEDGSFLRLNTLTLGYTLPQKLTQKILISNLRVYASVYNVFTISGYSGLDPEVNADTELNKQAYPTTGLDWNAYPRARSFVVGVNLNF